MVSCLSVRPVPCNGTLWSQSFYGGSPSHMPTYKCSSLLTLDSVLKYYNGILFLTTNRVGTLDEAFKSRVHLSLYYPAVRQDADGRNHMHEPRPFEISKRSSRWPSAASRYTGTWTASANSPQTTGTGTSSRTALADGTGDRYVTPSRSRPPWLGTSERRSRVRGPRRSRRSWTRSISVLLRRPWPCLKGT